MLSIYIGFEECGALNLWWEIIINKVDSNYIVLMLGLTQLFSGLSHIKTSKSLDRKEGYNGNKIIGVVISIMGIFLVIASSIKILEK
ncbi:hypothetical protein A500_14428 [Clostridium sartagoforme AAU1]|uniref:Uncharacterized protein n=1 Tax=Clostridium sartagoforme AAU1 TaxID=1202534 RepID=R9BVN1_9CLOT|nr:hypothetical protein [Clostridium sartagoforme]EOR21108.1 hypothetical protein A500_14428 [Clostridium sartagoforme AAU1]